jgi:valyl-tRNA synthetase
MVMMGLEFMKDVPFHDVLINGTILDELGRRMSKSLGNGVDPIDMIDVYGADAVRFSLIMLTTEGQDVKLSESKFEMGRNFANKVWNASRFTLMCLGEGEQARLSADELAGARRFEDRWLLSRLAETTRSVNDHLEGFRCNEAARALYEFFWHELCDWYVEAVKSRLRDNADAKDRASAAETLAGALDQSLRLLHPFAPFLTEQIWQSLKESAAEAGLAAADSMTAEGLIVSRWPVPDDALRDPAVEEQMGLLQDLIRAVRHLRREKNILDKTPIRVVISCPDEKTDAVVAEHAELLKMMAVLERVDHGVEVGKPPHAATSVVGTTEVFVPLEGLIDLDKERARLDRQRQEVGERIAKIEKQLHNHDFLANAPEEVVQKRMDRAQELREQLQKVIQNLAELD